MWRPFCHPEELSATISSFNTAVLLTTVWLSSLLAKRLFICTAEWYSVCCSNNFSSLLSPVVRPRVQPICDSKGQSHLECCLRSGVPFFPVPLCWIQSHTLESRRLVPTTICIPVNPQLGACEECVPHLKLSEMDKRAVILIFLLSLSHLLASLLHKIFASLFIYLFILVWVTLQICNL